LRALGDECQRGYLRVSRQQRLDEMWLTNKMTAASGGGDAPLLPDDELAEPTQAWAMLMDKAQFPRFAALLDRHAYRIDAFRINYKFAKRLLEIRSGFGTAPRMHGRSWHHGWPNARWSSSPRIRTICVRRSGSASRRRQTRSSVRARAGTRLRSRRRPSHCAWPIGRLDGALNRDDLQDVGRRAREILIDCAALLADPALVPAGQAPPKTGDAKAWLDLFLAAQAEGAHREDLRRLIHATRRLAQTVTHGDVERIEAFAAAQATVLVVRTLQALSDESSAASRS
jgi:hypothetical protein